MSCCKETPAPSGHLIKLYSIQDLKKRNTNQLFSVFAVQSFQNVYNSFKHGHEACRPTFFRAHIGGQSVHLRTTTTTTRAFISGTLNFMWADAPSPPTWRHGASQLVPHRQRFSQIRGDKKLYLKKSFKSTSSAEDWITLQRRSNPDGGVQWGNPVSWTNRAEPRAPEPAAATARRRRSSRLRSSQTPSC